MLAMKKKMRVRWLSTVSYMGVSRGGGVQGLRMHPLEFENDEVICCSPTKYPNYFARAPDAHNYYT